jgi:hypothetical protein
MHQWSRAFVWAPASFYDHSTLRSRRAVKSRTEVLIGLTAGVTPAHRSGMVEWYGDTDSTTTTHEKYGLNHADNRPRFAGSTTHPGTKPAQPPTLHATTNSSPTRAASSTPTSRASTWSSSPPPARIRPRSTTLLPGKRRPIPLANQVVATTRSTIGSRPGAAASTPRPSTPTAFRRSRSPADLPRAVCRSGS